MRNSCLVVVVSQSDIDSVRQNGPNLGAVVLR